MILDLDEQEKEKKIKESCQKFFDEAILNLYNLEKLDTSFLEENQELLEKKFEDQEEKLDELKGKIQTIVDPVNQCKEPHQVLRDKLIEKYLKKYLDLMATPKLPSFKYDEIDVLLHPEVYTLKSDRFEVPKFDQFQMTESKQMVLLPKERKVELQPLNKEIEE